MNLDNIKKVLRGFQLIGFTFNVKVWYQFLWINFFRKNSYASLKKLNLIIPTSNCVFDIHPTAKIVVEGIVIVGYSKVKGSTLETRIQLENDSKLSFNDRFTIYAGADIQVFKTGELIFNGGASSGCNLYCQIICADKILIGKDTLIGRNVVIRDYDAHYIIQDNYKIKAPIIIGDNCWITEGALISKGVTIGNGSIVAARSWVIRNVPEKTLVGGSPAMPIQKNIEWKI